MWRIVQKNVHSGRSIQAPAVLLQWSHGLISRLGLVDEIGKKGRDTVWQNFFWDPTIYVIFDIFQMTIMVEFLGTCVTTSLIEAMWALSKTLKWTNWQKNMSLAWPALFHSQVTE